MPDPITSFGGVQLYTDQIHSKWTEFEGTNLKYSVFFKNGVKLTYPEQPAYLQASASSERLSEDENMKNKSSFLRLMNAEISGDKYVEDNIGLLGCKDCKVNVKDDYDKYDTPKRDIVIQTDIGDRLSVNNQILTDEYDITDD